MTDCNAFAGGLLCDRCSKLDQHLNATFHLNCKHTDVRGGDGTYALVDGCPNGLIIMTERPTQQTDQQGARAPVLCSPAPVDERGPCDYIRRRCTLVLTPPCPAVPSAVWEMASYDHASLVIQRATSSDAGVAAVNATLAWLQGKGTGYSQRINDQWNTAGITSNDGLPSITSHYGYHMTHWHVALALSGQRANLTAVGDRELTFAPKAGACGFTLPVLLPRLAGTIACAGSRYTLRVTVGGPLTVDVLAVHGHAYAGGLPVVLQTGSVLSWQ